MENTKKNLELVERKNLKVKVVIEKSLETIIRGLCVEFPSREWSGTVFYRTEGTFEKGLTVYCEDFFLEHIGTIGTTEVQHDSSLAAYMFERDLIEFNMGILHSHHNMGAFFSITDMNALKQEGTDMNHALSIVVANDGNYVARITRRVNKQQELTITGTEVQTYNTWEDIPVSNTYNVNVPKSNTFEVVEYCNCTVEVETATVPQHPFKERIEELLAKESKPVLRTGSTHTDYIPFKLDYESSTINAKDLLLLGRILLGNVFLTRVSQWEIDNYLQDLPERLRLLHIDTQDWVESVLDVANMVDILYVKDSFNIYDWLLSRLDKYSKYPEIQELIENTKLFYSPWE